MNGGKTTLLLQNAYSIRSRGKEVVILGYGGNHRDDGIFSRIGASVKPDILFSHETNIYESIKTILKNSSKDYLEVLVDEAQFLTPFQVEELLRLSLDEKIDVRCFGLKTSFKTKSFPGSRRLLELAKITELKIVRCSCGDYAEINARFDSATKDLILFGEEELIEGSSENIVYDPICYSCYLKAGGKLHY